MIVTKHPTKALTATNDADGTRCSEPFRSNQPYVKTSVNPFPVVMRRECGERSAQVGFAEDDDSVQALLLDRPNKPLRVRIAVGCLTASARRGCRRRPRSVGTRRSTWCRRHR